MAWIDVPPKFQRPPGERATRALGYAITALATLLLGAVWLLGPFALTALFASRGQYILAAVCAVISAVWLYGLVKDWTAVGFLLAAPASLWMIFQELCGKIDTEDLEDGRWLSLDRWRAPSDREREILELLTRHSDIAEIHEQIAVTEIRAECVCGCPSVRFFSSGASIPRDRTHRNERGEQDELTFSAVTTDAQRREVLVELRLHLGTLHSLEVTIGGLHEGEPRELPPASSLRPAPGGA